MSGELPIVVATNDAPVDESKEKVSMKEFCENLQDKLEDYWIDLSYKLDEAREEYEIVDDGGNSIEHLVEWDEFSAYPFIEISYRGRLLSPEEKAVDDFRESVKTQNRWVNRFWTDIQNTKEPLFRSGGDVYPKSFGHQLSFIIFSAQSLDQKQKEAIKKIDASESLSPEEKHSFVQQINELAVSAKLFIEKGEEK